MTQRWDAVVVGAGPNGLTAAATMARAGRTVLVLEAAEEIGGGTRTDDLFGRGTRRDVCSAVHPTGYASPAFADLGLLDRLDWIVPDVSVAHVFSPTDVLGLRTERGRRDVDLGVDGDAWRRWVDFDVEVAHDVFGMPEWPRRPWAMARFGSAAVMPVDAFARTVFRDERTRTAFSGIAAHAGRPTTAPGSTAPGLLLGMLVGNGWPVVAGGSQRIAEALADIVRAGGGRIETDCRIDDVAEVPPAEHVFFDVSPRALIQIMGERLPSRYARSLDRFTYGGGVCKVDFSLREPIPWAAATTETLAATATFHLAADRAQIRETEAAVAAGRLPERPWVLGGEPTRIDPSRVAAGEHLAWAYCHVPAGCDVDVSDRIVAEIERCAPGFRQVILEKTVTTATDFAAHNPNYVGGDINCGAATLRQLLARPVARRHPQRTPVPGVYLCSSATAPGGGVHGMCGYRAAVDALRSA